MAPQAGQGRLLSGERERIDIPIQAPRENLFVTFVFELLVTRECHERPRASTEVGGDLKERVGGLRYSHGQDLVASL